MYDYAIRIDRCLQALIRAIIEMPAPDQGPVRLHTAWAESTLRPTLKLMRLLGQKELPLVARHDPNLKSGGDITKPCSEWSLVRVQGRILDAYDYLLGLKALEDGDIFPDLVQILGWLEVALSDYLAEVRFHCSLHEHPWQWSLLYCKTCRARRRFEADTCTTCERGWAD